MAVGIKRTVSLLAVAGMLLAVPVGSAQTASAATKTLLWSQEFNGKSTTKLDSKIWGFDLGSLNANSEEQIYTNYPSNIRMDGKGKLIIQARPVIEGSKLWERCISCKFSSARIKTQNKIGFKYGRMEARIKMPAGVGTWPAFWMLGADLEDVGWPNSGEIDIVEGRGADPTIVFGTAHGPGYNGSEGNQIGNYAYSPTALSDGYHIYAVEWAPNVVKWYFDGQLYHTLRPSMTNGNEYVFNKEFFVILNLAMGGTFAGDLDPALTGAAMYVDYIRYYKLGKYGRLYKH